MMIGGQGAGGGGGAKVDYGGQLDIQNTHNTEFCYVIKYYIFNITLESQRRLVRASEGQ